MLVTGRDYAQAMAWEEGPPRGAAPSEAGWLGSGSRGVAQVFNKVLSSTPGPQGPRGGLRETVQSSPSRPEYRVGVRRQKQRIQVRKSL